MKHGCHAILCFQHTFSSMIAQFAPQVYVAVSNRNSTEMTDGLCARPEASRWQRHTHQSIVQSAGLVILKSCSISESIVSYLSSQTIQTSSWIRMFLRRLQSEYAGCYQPKNGLICHWPITIPTVTSNHEDHSRFRSSAFDSTYQSIDNPLSINGSREVVRSYRLINAWSLWLGNWDPSNLLSYPPPFGDRHDCTEKALINVSPVLFLLVISTTCLC